MRDLLHSTYLFVRVAMAQFVKYTAPISIVIFMISEAQGYYEGGLMLRFSLLVIANIIAYLTSYYVIKRLNVIESAKEELGYGGEIDRDEERASVLVILFMIAPWCGLMLRWVFKEQAVMSVLVSPLSLIPFVPYLHRMMDGTFYLYNSPALMLFFVITLVTVYLFDVVEPSMRVAARLLCGLYGKRTARLVKQAVIFTACSHIVAGAAHVMVYQYCIHNNKNSPYAQTILLRKYGLISYDVYLIRMLAHALLLNPNISDEMRERLNKTIEIEL